MGKISEALRPLSRSRQSCTAANGPNTSVSAQPDIVITPKIPPIVEITSPRTKSRQSRSTVPATSNNMRIAIILRTTRTMKP